MVFDLIAGQWVQQDREGASVQHEPGHRLGQRFLGCGPKGPSLIVGILATSRPGNICDAITDNEFLVFDLLYQLVVELHGFIEGVLVVLVPIDMKMPLNNNLSTT